MISRVLESTPAEAAIAAAFRAAPRTGEAIEAFRRFEAVGLPSRRVESWHYTDLRRALAEPAPFAPAPDAARLREVGAALDRAPRLAAIRLVLVDGHFVPALSDALRGLRPGAPTLGLGEREDAMIAFAGAFAQGGFACEVQDQAEIEIVHAGRAAVASHVRFAFLPGARGLIVERTLGAAQRHRLASVELGAGAKVEHVALVEEAGEIEIESLRVSLAEGAAFRGFGLVSAGKLVRRQIFARLDGVDAKLALSGLSLLDGTRLADTTLEVRHAAPHGESREFFRHIVADEAQGVYQGKVIVDQIAQKTDGGMKSQALLLSPTAQMNNKPELEIFADDVVCGHGATVGALDPQQIFYLQARGIPHKQAEAMLLEAFGVEAIERVSDATIAEALKQKLADWLKRRAA